MADDAIPLDEARRRRRKRPARASDGAAPPDPDGDGRDVPDDEAAKLDCPVLALGQRNGIYYFMSVAGEKRELKPRDMTVLGMLSLFNGDPTWLFQHFARLDKKGKPTGEIEQASAAAALMRFCASAGLWSEETPMHGLGVWRDGDEIIANCGDALVIYGPKGRRVERAGQRRGAAIYVAAPTIERPAEIAATAAEAKAVGKSIRALWNFSAPHLARLVFGFIGLAMLGEAPAWRVHILLIGKRGGGKTTLLKLIRAGLGPQANYMNDPTEAGLRELLSDQARAIAFDEAGASGGENRGMRVDAIIGLLRRMAGDEGAKSVRGTGSGAKQFMMAGSAALAAANAPTLDAQDRSRILEVDVLPADPANEEAAKQAIADAEALSPALRARALAGWQRFNDNLAVYRAALTKAECDQRQADQLGTLMAAAEMMLSDEPIDSDSAAEQIEKLSRALKTYRLEDEELSNARLCLATLMTTQIEHWKGGSKSTIGRLVLNAREPGGSSERLALRVYGLRLILLPDDDQELWVANQHEGLSKIFAHSPWKDGGWRRALLQLADAKPSEKPMQFDGHKSRFVIIPRPYLPDREAAEKEPDPGPIPP